MPDGRVTGATSGKLETSFALKFAARLHLRGFIALRRLAVGRRMTVHLKVAPLCRASLPLSPVVFPSTMAG